MLTQAKKQKKIGLKLTVLLLWLALAVLLPSPVVWGQSNGDLIAEQPVLVITGQGVIADGLYTAANISFERSYTLEELKAIADADPKASADNQYLFSAINTNNTKSFYRAEGARIDTLFALSSANTANTVSVRASDNYTIVFDPTKETVGETIGARITQAFSKARYYYPNLTMDSPDGQVEVPSIISWADSVASTVAELPVTVTAYGENRIRNLSGQLAINDYNNPLFQQAIFSPFTIFIGEELTVPVLKVGSIDYTRAELLLLPRAEWEYTYTTQNGERTDKVRGVPLAVLLEAVDDEAVIEFQTVDNWADIVNYTMSLSELVEKNAILAYERWNNDAWSGYLDGSGATQGYFRLFVEGMSPAQRINTISVKTATTTDSPYKHISYEGAPYNLDAITGATLTVEGPGVATSTPITVRFAESTADTNIHQGVYSDVRNDVRVFRTYEGVTLQSILDGQVDKTVERLDDNVVVVFKNRWRQEMARATYGDIKNAATPLILAYGTASADGSTLGPAPFVFNLAAGIIDGLGNDDGPLKLVYDQSEPFASANSNMPATGKFGSIAYLYVEEGAPPPGFKHSTAADEAYKNAANTEHIITLTGSTLGKEVNFTVAELEAMVEYDTDNKPKAGGMGYRDEYSLSNTTYWYVNEYEGIKVWDLLTDIGIDAATYKDDENTYVSFSAWDNWPMETHFSMKQLANPDLFYYYEKSPLDIGSENRPTKAQLATAEYHPDNQIGVWTADHNGYPVKKGYPVVLAYGVNGYPYVRDEQLPGYKSGLGNSGGPLRVIYGKADNLTQAAPEDYAYFFNNGSKQLKAVQEIYVGDEKRYSTHFDNPHPAYQAMKDDLALTVEIISDGETIKTETFTLEQLEKILYDVSKSVRDNSGRQEKGYYFYNVAGGSDIQDLFEGVSLEYLLTEHIGMPGILGSVELYSGAATTPAATYDLTTISEKGKNSLNGASGLGMAVAFAKNGYPLVELRDDSGANGYVHTDDITGKTVQNRNGPLLFVRGQTDDEYAAGIINTGSGAKTSVNNLSKIVVRLQADSFAHVGAEYAAYASQKVLFSGAIASPSGVEFTVGALETKQKYMVTDSYTVGGETKIYRGLDLYALLRDDGIRASNMMDAITVKNSAGEEKELTLSQLTAGGKKIILAYGMASASDLSDAAPLITASGGPLRLIIDNGSAADCVANVSEIAVSRSEQGNWWKHDFGVYTDYTGPAYDLEISGASLVHNKTFSVSELEAMEDIFVSDYYSAVDWYVQGLDLYKLLLSIGIVENADITVRAIASDTYTQTFAASLVKNGAGSSGKPLLIAFGRGNKDGEGLPLAPSDGRNSPVSPGYDPEIGNSGGPLRLLPDTSGGNSVQRLVKIIVGEEGGNPDPDLFNIYGLKGGAKSYKIAELKDLPDGMGTKISAYTYTSSGSLVTETVKGAYLYDILKANGVSDNAVITVNTTDEFENTSNGANYCDIPMTDIKEQQYFLAYKYGANENDLKWVADERNGITSKVRLYCNFDATNSRRNRLTDIKGVTVKDYTFTLYAGGQEGMPQASIRAVVADNAGGIWAGSNGAGAVYINATGEISSFTTPQLKTDFVTGLALAPDGGVWLSQGGSVGSQNAPPSAHYGFASYINGQFTFYDTNSLGSTLPNDCIYGIDVDKDGNVWLAAQHTLLNGGMEGGLTKFTPSTNTWRTWKMADGLPTVSAWAVKGDGKGGAWVTTYRSSNVDLPWPDKSYAQVSATGVVTSYDIPAGKDFTWSRSIAIDPEGGVYITRMSGAHDPANNGGWLDYIAPNGSVKSYKGDDLVPDLKAKASQGFYPEIRMVFVDEQGNLWLSTNGLGVYRCTVSGGNIIIVENYSSTNGSWPAGAFDDVWCMYVSPEGKVCFGSNGGVVTADIDITPPDRDYVGDATEATAELKIIGAVEKPGYFTVNGLKTYPGVTERTRDYNWQNSAGSTDKDTMTGVYLEDLLKNVMTLNSNAESITVTAKDGYTQEFNLDTNEYGVYWTDRDGNKMMLAWRGTNSRTDRTIVDFDLPRLIVGQKEPGDVNRNMWVSDIVTIAVNSSVIISPDPIALDPPFTIKGWGSGDITWAIGGGGNSIKNLSSGHGGKVVKSYPYYSSSQNRTDKVAGALLIDILTASGISGDDVRVTINTADGYTQDSYNNLTLAEIASKEYLLAYDIYNANDVAEPIEDIYDNNTKKTTLRIYRNHDDGSSGLNRIRTVGGVTISKDGGGGGPVNPPGGSSVGDATEATADLKITGAVAKPGYFTLAGLKAYSSAYSRTREYNWQNNADSADKDTMIGVYLEDLLKNVMTLNSNAESITVTAKDNYQRSFNLDASEYGVYWTDRDGNKMMLAWRGTNSRTDRTIVDFDLPRLIVGQKGPGDVNRDMWVSDIVSITVNTRTVISGGGTTGNYAQQPQNIVTAVEEITKGVSLTLKANVKVENGLANASNTAEEISKALTELASQADAAEATLKTLLIDAATKEQTTKTIYTLPAQALKLLTDDAKTNVELMTDQGRIILSAALLKQVASDDEQALIIELGKASTASAGELAAVDIAIRMGDTVITNFNGLLLKADIPFTPQASMQPAGLVVYHVAEDNQKNLLKLAAYDTESKTMRLGLTHLSKYVIGYNPVTFADIQGHWGKSSIEFLASRYIVNGRGADIFDPEGKVSRAEFVKMLAEAADDIDIAGAANAGFSDVVGGAWYAPYINWAAGLGIAQGHTDGTFRPNGLITREQMAAMTDRFIKAMKYELKITQNAKEFTDHEQISSFAEGAITAMRQYGIMEGNPDGSFIPQGQASRAEAAKVIETFIKALLW